MRYMYRNIQTGEMVEMIMTIEEKDRQEVHGLISLPDGSIGVRDYSAEHGRFIDVCAREIRSDALGCNPDQVAEFAQQSIDIGVPTQFDQRTGEAIFENREHRNKYMRALNSYEEIGLIDRDGGYGDPT